MTRSPRLSQVRRWLLLGWLVVGSGWLASAQPATDSIRRDAPASTSSKWPWVLVLLVGVGLGVLGAKLLGRRSAGPVAPPAPAEPEIARPGAQKPAAQNVPRENRPVASQPASGKGRSTAKAGGRVGESVQERLIRKEMEKKWHDDHQKPTQLNRPNAVENRSKPAFKPPTPATPPLKTAKTPPMDPNPADANANESLSLGQTIDLSPKPIQELIDETATVAPASAEMPVAAPRGPMQFYAPAPDVPSIEHRKLSPNPLPQMPLLITLPGSDASTAQFSFSPQADQSRIIGNGVRELKEFFQFELPPTEQFTTIKNLAPGKLEKRDDTWYVVDKATIALS